MNDAEKTTEAQVDTKDQAGATKAKSTVAAAKKNTPAAARPTAAAKPKAAGPAKATVTITAKKYGFRRCGMAHPAEATTHPAEKFTAKELAILEAEVMLVVVRN